MRSRWVGTATREPFLPRNGGTDGFLKALHPTQPPERSCGSLVRAVRALFNPCSRNAVCWSAVPPATGGMCCSDHRATLRPCKPRSCQSRRSIRQLARVACLNESRGKLAPHDSPPPTPRSTAKGSLGPPNSGDRSARPGLGLKLRPSLYPVGDGQACQKGAGTSCAHRLSTTTSGMRSPVP